MEKILQPGISCCGMYEMEEGGLLVDARDYYRAFYHAAGRAREQILVCGWQFDSKVHLLRGKDAREANDGVEFLQFLRNLCELRPRLTVYLLAWDFSVIFALEREWFQDWKFIWSGHERIRFLFDKNHPVGGTHHQKFVVIDGSVAFVGGMDICSFRWDDRRHLWRNPERIDGGGREYDPYHDIQGCVRGAVCKRLAELFLQRWVLAGGETFDLMEGPARDIPLGSYIAIKGKRVAVSRTATPTLATPQKPVLQIRSLYMTAIRAAEEYIYIENQYFSSVAVFEALIARMEARERPRLNIVIIVPKKPQALSEELFLGVPQMKLLRALVAKAEETGHSLGVYYTVALSPSGNEKMVYIHSKLLMVDDRFLTVGSANTTNRSLGLDSELNLSWESWDPVDDGLIQSLERIRVDILLDHAGIRGWRWRRRLRQRRDMVKEINRLIKVPGCKLRAHDLMMVPGVGKMIGEMGSGFVDPERPVVEENVFEFYAAPEAIFNGIADFQQWLVKKSKEEVGAMAFLDVPGQQPVPPSQPESTASFYVLMTAIGLVFLILLWFFIHGLSLGCQ